MTPVARLHWRSSRRHSKVVGRGELRRKLFAPHYSVVEAFANTLSKGLYASRARAT
jgi:hypothetical protein